MSIFDTQLNEHDLDSLYSWVDNLPLSRPKKNISRDFSDAVLMAETISFYYPKLVQLHNYPSTNSIKSKIANWKTLNQKVLGKLGLSLRQDQCQKLASSTPMMIQVLLCQLKKSCGEAAPQNKQSHMYHHSNNYNQSTNNRRNLVMQDFQTMENGHPDNQNRKKDKQPQVKGLQVTKIQELKEILKLLKQKISFVEKNIQRKDAEIKELEDIIHLGL